MTLQTPALPQLSEADPLIDGEGSLDPLGLTRVADSLAELLLPGLRARMRRIRFVTASAVGALAADGLGDVPAGDGKATPSICFEWIVLESFARQRGSGSPLEVSGVPGSAKTRGVIAQGHRLTATNYLKSPSVFGFTGVYLPLARHFCVLDGDRAPAAETTALTLAWEEDHDLQGFTEDRSGSAGGSLRRDVAREIERALRAGRCEMAPRSRIPGRLADSLHPERVGPCERKLLTTWLCREDEPVRSWLASAVWSITPTEWMDERELAVRLRARRPPARVAVLLDAIAAYEDACWWLDVGFRQLRHRSTMRGSAALTPDVVADDSVLAEVCSQLPQAMAEADRCLIAADQTLWDRFDQQLGAFRNPMLPAELMEALLAHHVEVQRGKAPHGKRPWFEEYGNGWVVRRLYGHADEVDPTAVAYLHPYRLIPLYHFSVDLTP